MFGAAPGGSFTYWAESLIWGMNRLFQPAKSTANKGSKAEAQDSQVWSLSHNCGNLQPLQTAKVCRLQTWRGSTIQFAVRRIPMLRGEADLTVTDDPGLFETQHGDNVSQTDL